MVLGAVEAKGGELMMVKITVNGKQGDCLLDTGATTSFMNKEFAEAAGVQVGKSGATIKLASGVLAPALGATQQVQFSVARKGGGMVNYHEQFEVTELSGYDAILGISWFEQARPQFVWDEERPVQMVVRGKDRRGQFRRMMLELIRRETQEVNQLGVVQIKLDKEKKGEEEKIEQEKEVKRSTQEQRVYDRLVQQFADVFPKELPDGLPPRRPGLEHRIKLKPHNKTPYRRPYTSGPEELELLKSTLGDLMKKGFIQRSQSRFGAPVLFTPKKDGTMRMVIDYREINKITIKNGYPLPATEELFPIVHGARYFSKIDLHSGYYQIRIAEEDQEKTAFVTRYGSYEFLVLPMGLCNSPGTFMELMNFVFEAQLDRFVIVFLDDVLVFSKSLGEHERHMREVLSILRKERLYAKMSKCDLVRREVDFLGHRIGEEGLTQEAAKTEAVVNWPTPKTKKEVQQFLGLAGYYRKFVQGYSKIAAPLIKLTGGTVHFQWGREQEVSFCQLKKALTQAPVLALPDPSKPWVIHTDASVEALGAVLQQDQGRGLQPVGYMSLTLKDAETRYPTHEQEMLAIVTACDYWRHLLSGREVTVKSDHHSLQKFFEQRKLSKRQVRWMEELAEFDLTIRYVKGKKNTAADALSRKEGKGEDEAEVTFESLGWKEEKVEGTHDLFAVRRANRGAKKVLSEEEEKEDREKCRRAATENLEPDDQLVAPRREKGGAIATPSQRCTANTTRGGRCKAVTRVGQYCWNHLRQREGLRVKQSAMGKKVGLGLFAEKDFKVEDTICLYTGDWDYGDEGGPYALQVSRRKIIDAARKNAAPGRWANDPRGSGQRPNARFSYNALRRTATLKAIRPITKGEEVLVSYGAQYWKGTKWAEPMKKREEEEEKEEKKEEREVIEINAVTRVDLANELLKECEKDEEYSERRKRIREGKGEPGERVEGGLIHVRAKMVVPNTDRARLLVVQEFHDADSAGHLGRDKTVHRIKLRFEWVGVDQYVADYVASCVQCQQNKDSNQQVAGKLMSLPIPNRPWQIVGLDFMGPFPEAKSGADAVAVMVCHLTKAKHIVGTTTRLTAKGAAEMMYREVVRLHGMIEVLVTDRDTRFTASFWQELWRLVGVKLAMGTAYHPQTDGQTERENRTIAQVIRTIIREDQEEWDTKLPVVEMAVNSAVQASTGQSPFMMNHGREMTLPGDVQLGTGVGEGTNPAAGEMAKKMRRVWEEATRQLERAKERQRVGADKRRRKEEFKVGDKVLLSTEHIKLVGAKYLNHSVKFSAKFIGPFKIQQVINANAYKLELPGKFEMHPTVNVSRLKRFVEGDQRFSDREIEDWRPEGLVVKDDNGAREWEVSKVLAHRGRTGRKQYLVKWKGYPLYEATWEPEANLENAKAKLRQFWKRLEEGEREEGLVGIFKEVENGAEVKSETGS